MQYDHGAHDDGDVAPFESIRVINHILKVDTKPPKVDLPAQDQEAGECCHQAMSSGPLAPEPYTRTATY